MTIKRLGVTAAAWTCSTFLLVAGAHAQPRFITVYQNADELEADRLLASALGRELVESPEERDYEAVIRALIADERKGGIVARVTPYAMVVAEMRGAKLDPIAVCRSRSTGRTVTNAFLVARRSQFPSARFPEGPSLEQVLDYIRMASDAEMPARFIYHNKLSTSSFFLPSLVFRAQKVFADDPRVAHASGITAVRVAPYDTRSSSDLVRAVATGGADLAAVWDGPKSGFDDSADVNYAPVGSLVWFVPLSTTLPCDVLVATRRVDATTKRAIRDSLQARQTVPLDDGGKWDVASWILWTNREAEDAHRALSDLRRRAASSALPVVVDVRNSEASPVADEALDAVRASIRLSGTELIDRSAYYEYYLKFDTRWELEQIHAGSVRLTVRYDNFKLDGAEVVQQFEISFLTPSDLTKRVVSLIHTRLHRIRPVWLYMDAEPTVLRDVGFDVAARVPFQELEWNDPQRNDYRLRGEPREAALTPNQVNFALEKASFPTRQDGSLDFDPMGRRSFRVLLVRPTTERALFQALTVLFLVFIVLAAAGLVWDAWRMHMRAASGRGAAPADRGVGQTALPRGGREGRDQPDTKAA